MSRLSRSPDMVKVKIAYGKGEIEFPLPSSRFLGTLENDKIVRNDIRSLLKEAFERLLGGATLEDVIRGKRKVILVVPDYTRRAHLKDVLPYILSKIDGRTHEVSIIIATGMHKAPDTAQLKSMLGDAIARRYRILSHSPTGRAIVGLGSTSGGVPIWLNRNLFQSDVVLSIGIIEPHLYAGYSGGVKTVAIGLAGEETISVTHGIRFLDDPLTAIGSISHNPFQLALREITLKTPLKFSVNIVNDQCGNPAKIFCGLTVPVFEDGVKFARTIYEREAERPSRIAVCGVGYPKDINLYQASRAVNYVVNVDRPVVRKGGVIIVASELADGPGTSQAELRFYETLKKMGPPEKFVKSMKRSGYLTGEHRTYMVALALMNYEVVFVSLRNRGLFKGLPFKYFNNMEDALRYADTITGHGSKIYAIPHALATVARLG